MVLGLAGALAVTRVMASMLVGVEPTDPMTFAAIALLFVGDCRRRVVGAGVARVEARSDGRNPRRVGDGLQTVPSRTV